MSVYIFLQHACTAVFCQCMCLIEQFQRNMEQSFIRTNFPINALFKSYGNHLLAAKPIAVNQSSFLLQHIG